MIRLVRSELLRFRSRRLVKALTVLASIAILATAGIILVRSHPVTDAERTAATTRSERAFRSCMKDPHFPKNALPDDTTRREYCRSNTLPEYYLADGAFHLSDTRNFVESSALLVAIVAWLVGASLAGAEWQAGSMVTLLTWEPRRTRVLVAKAISVALGAAIVTLAADVALEGLLWAAAAARGSTDGIGSSFARDLLFLDVRVMSLAAISAVLGFSLAMVARNTAAAIGIAFAYLSVVEGLMRVLRPGWAPYLLGDNANVLVLGQPGLGRSVAGAVVVLLVYVGVFVGVATATLRARDIG